MEERALPRKLTVRAHGATLVLVKRPEESAEHVLQKALLWALYLPDFPSLRVEVPLPTPSRYKPDLLVFEDGRPRFWAECGAVSASKLQDLLRRFRHTHFVFSKWGGCDLGRHPFAGMIERALEGYRRTAAVEFICFPVTATEYIAPGGDITLSRGDVPIVCWG